MDSLQKKAYAEHLIEEHARVVEFLTVFEMYPEYAGVPEDDIDDISEDDARDVATLISKATVEVYWR